ncbi:T9SS type A sorting domain-containing protein [Portibacter lacus]|uniref:HYR domain-containing protein n=1 Tax=Portibacter lacus TaxID=1099794 RepID=A0AA37WHW0_9BACT|nr:T9SS type A sorting domain-containing protein [Portibacter lacus]GLR20039.1 hypothetical protein GCM10007940_46550 [Portibacter lacus]
MKTFTYTLLILLVLGAITKLDAQSCSPGTITTQAQIDDLSANCSMISGDLIIEGAGITDLDPLYSIKSVTGDVIVRNCPILLNIQGLDGITTIGGDFIIQNTSVTGFGEFVFELTSIGGDIYIEDNNSLVMIHRMDKLVSIGGKLSVRNNSVLQGVNDFTALTTINQHFEMFANGNLQTLEFPELTTISMGMAFLNNNGNFSLNGFPKLQTISEGILLSQNNGLKQVNGFNALTTINTIYIISNDYLTQVNGFGNLLTNTIVSLTNNLFLTQINGFSKLASCSLIQINGNGDIISLNGFGLLSSAETIEFKDNLITAARSSANLDLLGFNNLTSVTNLSISGNNILSNISGFSNLQSATDIEIENNFGLTSISGFASFTTLNNLAILANPSLTSITGFQALKTVNDYFHISSNPMLNTMGNFNAVETGNLVFDYNDALTTINGFSSHTYGDVGIYDNANLTTVNAWVNLTSGYGFQILNNPKLSTVNGFENFDTNVEFVVIRNNPMLSVCCWALPAIAAALSSNNGIVSISGNAAGCASLAQIDQAPVLNNCPADITTNADENECTVFISLTDPTITDNCGYESYKYNLVSNGTSNLPQDASEGISFDYFLPVGISTITWEVIDESGNNDVCVTKITVEDNQFPVFTSELPASFEIETSPTSCIGVHSLTFPPATDNCEIIFREISVYIEGIPSTFYLNNNVQEGQTYDIELEPGVYTVEAKVKDASNKIDQSFTQLTVSDETSPVYLGAIPNDVTVQTQGAGCTIDHEITFPEFEDNCAIALSSLIVLVEGSNEIVYDNSGPVGGTTYTVSLEPGEYWVEYYLIDESDNENDTRSYITVEDGTAPVITLNQADVTVNCNQSPPTIPQIGSSIFANDACDGDVTANMTATSSTSSGDCTFGQEQESTTYTYTATDNNGNTSEKSFTITIINNEAVELGADKVGCTGESVELTSTGLSGSYLWSTGATTSSISVNTAGTYSLTVTGASGCCSIDDVNVSFQNDPDASATGGVIGCSTNSIQLTGSSTSTGVSYTWTGPGGFVSNQQNPTVSSLGDYILTVSTSAGCSTTATASVSADTDVPNASASGGNLNCSTSSVQLMGASTTSGVSYSWTGPDNFTSSDQSPTVSVAGIYTLTVKAENDCSVTVDAEVIDDTTVPEVTLNEGIINCTSPEITLTPETIGDIASYSWTGPDNLTADSETLTITKGGNYTITVTGTNTCSANTSITVVEDLESPNISAEGGEIDCSASQVTLTGSSTTAGASFSWSGPNDFSASIANPVVITPGTYTLTVTGENGCTATSSVELTSDVEIPIITAMGGTIDCINTSIEITASSDTDGLTYSWTGPNSFIGNTADISVNEPGTYTVVATHSNGCTAQDIVEVIDNTQAPTISISAEDINCSNLESKVLSESSTDVISFSWTGQDGFSSTDEEPTISVAGTYDLVVTSENGCTAEASITITSDFTEPEATASGGTLSCSLNAITLEVVSSGSNLSFIWSGPDGFNSTVQNPEVTQAGTYTLIVTAENGCTTEVSADVVADTDLPVVTAAGGTIDCNHSEVTLMGSTTTSDATFSWSGPNGFSSDMNNPVVTSIGEYTFTVVSSTGCSAFKKVQVLEDLEAPEVQLSLGEVSCEDSSITINSSLVNGLNYTWSGPDGFTSSEAQPIVSIAGIYATTVTGSNGCSLTTSIELLEDIAFETSVSVDGSDATLTITGGNGPFSIMWDNGSQELSASDLTDGEHSVIVTDELGCSQEVTFTILSSGVEEIEETLQIKAYPNPAIDVLNLSWKNMNKGIQNIQVLNQGGKIVFIKDFTEGLAVENLKINISQWSSGIYFIKYTNTEQIGVLKFAKL